MTRNDDAAGRSAVLPDLWLSVHMQLPAAIRPAIIGRDRQQSDLAAALADALAGHGRFCPQGPRDAYRLACGTGWAGIELAKAFPHIRVEGLDNDEASIAVGRQYAADHGVTERVDLEVVDLADESVDWSPRYDLALLIECVHDFPRLVP